MSDLNKKRGLYPKFKVKRTDGRDKPGEKHHGCHYIILDLDHDPCVWPALHKYAEACRATHPELSRDIDVMVRMRRSVRGGLRSALRFFEAKLLDNSQQAPKTTS